LRTPRKLITEDFSKNENWALNNGKLW
jgi:hypothetical protein